MTVVFFILPVLVGSGTMFLDGRAIEAAGTKSRVRAQDLDALREVKLTTKSIVLGRQ